MKHLILTTIMSGCVAMSLNAADPFADIESQVVANNTDLTSLAGANEADNLAAASENNLSDPEIEFEHLWGKGSVKWGAGISQSFEWPSLYGARSKANKAGAEARRLMFESERADLVFKSRQLMLEIVGIRQQMQFADSMISNLEHLLATTQLAMQRGQATRLDVSKARFALLSLKQEREGYTDLLQTSRSQLVALNGGKNVDISSLDSYPQASLLAQNEYIEAFDNNAPFAAAMRARVEAANAEAGAARLSSMPGFTVGYRHAYEEQTHFNGFSLGMSLPLFSGRHKRKAADAAVLAEKLGADSYTISMHADIAAAHTRARRMQARLDDFRKVFDDCDYTGILTRLYENGQINVIDYINEINYYLGVRREYLQLQNEYQLTLASLNRYL